MNECIESLGDARIFSTLDCNRGYWQVELNEADRDKTTITPHYGLYRFRRMPFGLRNTLPTFQRAVDIILWKVKWPFALVYLDEVLTYSTIFDEHKRHTKPY